MESSSIALPPTYINSMKNCYEVAATHNATKTTTTTTQISLHISEFISHVTSHNNRMELHNTQREMDRDSGRVENIEAKYV